MFIIEYIYFVLDKSLLKVYFIEIRINVLKQLEIIIVARLSTEIYKKVGIYLNLLEKYKYLYKKKKNVYLYVFGCINVY